jgi:hypothetical protein
VRQTRIGTHLAVTLAPGEGRNQRLEAAGNKILDVEQAADDALRLALEWTATSVASHRRGLLDAALRRHGPHTVCLDTDQ